MKNVTFHFFLGMETNKSAIFFTCIIRKHYRDMWDFIYESV